MRSKWTYRLLSKSLRSRTFVLYLLLLSAFAGCTKDVGKLPDKSLPNNYPPQIEALFLKKCATSGCHNSISYEAAGGLNLSTWDDLFAGSRGGAVVVPFRPDYSTLLFYINSYDQFGKIQLTPKMPYNSAPLSETEVAQVHAWILGGARSAAGEERFRGTRRKFYVANQGCDVVTVFDASTMLAMRYIDVGELRNIEAPHMVKVSPDNQHWYISFLGGGYFLKYQTSNDSLVGKTNLGVGSWNTFAFSSDSRKAYVVDWSLPGKIAIVDLPSMTHTVIAGFSFPHGSAMTKDDRFLYVTAQSGNYLYKFDVSDFGNYKKIILDETGQATEFAQVQPHEIIFSPDGSKYFVTCQASNDVRVLRTSNDSLLAVIKTGEFPQEMAVSRQRPLLFASCMEDTASGNIRKGSIAIINYDTHQLISTVYAGYQSHGIAVDDENNRVFVSNRNVSAGGPAPHHQSLCEGRNGYVTAIDLVSLQVVDGFKAEVSIDPYGLGIMH